MIHASGNHALIRRSSIQLKPSARPALAGARRMRARRLYSICSVELPVSSSCVSGIGASGSAAALRVRRVVPLAAARRGARFTAGFAAVRRAGAAFAVVLRVVVARVAVFRAVVLRGAVLRAAVLRPLVLRVAAELRVAGFAAALRVPAVREAAPRLGVPRADVPRAEAARVDVARVAVPRADAPRAGAPRAAVLRAAPSAAVARFGAALRPGPFAAPRVAGFAAPRVADFAAPRVGCFFAAVLRAPVPRAAAPRVVRVELLRVVDRIAIACARGCSVVVLSSVVLSSLTGRHSFRVSWREAGGSRTVSEPAGSALSGSASGALASDEFSQASFRRCDGDGFERIGRRASAFAENEARLPMRDRLHQA